MITKAPDGIPAGIHATLKPIGCIFPTAITAQDILKAEAWLRTQGCSTAYGPMYPQTWYPYRACLGPFERPFFWGEPQFSPELWQASGYQIISEYSSTLCANLPEIERHQSQRSLLEDKGWRFLSLSERDVSLTQLHALTLRSFENAFAYTPLDLSEFLTVYAPVLHQADHDLILFAVAPDDTVMGYCFALPDVHNPSLKQFIIKTLAVVPEARQQGVGGVLVGKAHEVAHGKGWSEGGIHALMWAGSHSQRITAHGGQVFRRYGLFSKEL